MTTEDQLKRCYGTYTVVSIGDHVRWEITNIGVILFGSDGEQIGARMDTLDRALCRGDCRREWQDMLGSVETFPQNFPTVKAARKTLQSLGHAMSMIQIREPLPTLIQPGTLDRLWESFVAEPSPRLVSKDT